MHPESKNPEEEIIDEDTVDETARDTLEEVDPILIATIKNQQKSTHLETEEATGPTSQTLWVKHRGSNRKMRVNKEDQAEN